MTDPSPFDARARERTKALLASAERPPTRQTRRATNPLALRGILAFVVTALLISGAIVFASRALHGAAHPSFPATSSTPAAVIPSSSSPSPTAAFLPAIGPQCTAQQLQMRSVGEIAAGAGSAMSLVVFTDLNPEPCVLRGTPVVHFLDAQGQVIATVSVQSAPGGMFPTEPNSGVGLVPLSTATSSSGVRGQAGLPLQYSHLMCATRIVGIAVTLPTGTLTAPLDGLEGSDFPGCSSGSVTVNPFQPAEAYR